MDPWDDASGVGCRSAGIKVRKVKWHEQVVVVVVVHEDGARVQSVASAIFEWLTLMSRCAMPMQCMV